MNLALWIVQGLLAALFLFGGIVKLMMPIEELTAQVPLPGLFIQFIAVCEVLGALGLILPWALRIQPVLTPLAAAGLVIITIGATVLTAAGVGGVDPVGAIFPGITALLCAFVAYGRSRPEALRRRAARQAVVQAAS
jgi:DoxX-like family